MSVKIYQGMIIDRDLSLFELRALVEKARPALDAIVEEEQLSAWARSASRIHDQALLGFDLRYADGAYSEHDSTPSQYAHRMVKELLDRHSTGRACSLPVGLEASLIAIGGGRTLMALFGHDDLRDAFAKMAGAREYAYWNNSDKPDEVSEADWERRRRDWRKALGEGFDSSFAEAGVAIKPVSAQYSFWNFEQEVCFAKAASLPAQWRARKLAAEFCKRAFLAEAGLVDAEGAPIPFSSHTDLVEARIAWRTAAESTHKPMIEVATDVLAASLPPLDDKGLTMGFFQLAAAGAGLRSMLDDRLALAAMAPSHPPVPHPKRSL